MPWWADLGLAAFTFFGGGFANELLALIRSREGPLWAEIKRLNARLDARDAELADARHERNDCRHVCDTVIPALQNEVNDLLERLGEPHRYDTRPKGT